MFFHTEHHWSDHPRTCASKRQPRGVNIQWWQRVVQNWQSWKISASLGALDDRILWDLGILLGKTNWIVERANEAEQNHNTYRFGK